MQGAKRRIWIKSLMKRMASLANSSPTRLSRPISKSKNTWTRCRSQSWGILMRMMRTIIAQVLKIEGWHSLRVHTRWRETPTTHSSRTERTMIWCWKTWLRLSTSKLEQLITDSSIWTRGFRLSGPSLRSPTCSRLSKTVNKNIWRTSSPKSHSKDTRKNNK